MPDELPKVKFFLYWCHVCGDPQILPHNPPEGAYPKFKYSCECGVTFYGDGTRPLLWDKHYDNEVMPTPLIEITPEDSKWVEAMNYAEEEWRKSKRFG